MLAEHEEFFRSAEKLGTKLAKCIGAMAIRCHPRPNLAGRHDEVRLSNQRGLVAEEQDG